MSSANRVGGLPQGYWPRPENRRVICLPVGTGTMGLLASTLLALARNTSPGIDVVALPLDVERAQLQQALRESPELARVSLAAAVGYDQPWQAVLRGLPLGYSDHDLVLALPGLEVPPGWDERLALAAYSRESCIAAVSPMSDSIPLFRLLDRSADQIALDALDRWLLTLSPRRNIEVPVMFSGCCYLQRAALKDIEARLDAIARDRGWDAAPIWLAQLFREHGWHTVCCDHVYVRDRDAGRCRSERNSIAQLEDAQRIEQIHPLTGLRFAVDDLLRRGAAIQDAPPAPRPVQLHIAHSWGGGLNRWVQQYCKHDRERDNLVLRSIGTWGAFGQRIALYRSAVMDQPLRYWQLDYPIRATATAHLQYRAILDVIIAEFRVEVILISSLIGHALDALASGLPTIFVAHDYYPFCPAVVIHFGAVCAACGLPRLTRCFAENEQNRFFGNVSAEEWISLRRRFADLIVDDRILFVASSESVSRHWRTLLPALADKPFAHISHGVDFVPERLPAPPAGDKLRVVVLGSLALQKGRGLLEQLWPRIATEMELYLVGCGEEGEAFRDQPGVALTPNFQHDELASIMAAIKPEVGLLLSVWPETFSYTLSELWLLGIPVVATDLGSFADRIQDGVNGFLCLPDAAALTEKLRWIAAHRTVLDPPRAWLAGFRHRSIDEMVTDYHALTPLPAFAAPRYFSVPATLAPVEEASPRTLYVDAQAPFARVLDEFGDYARQKLVASPRLRAWQKRGLAALLAGMLRAVRAVATLRRKG
jgi:glycosyltransferase involved in cell wall biosynthesis